jgi:hypothetical protein
LLIRAIPNRIEGLLDLPMAGTGKAGTSNRQFKENFVAAGPADQGQPDGRTRNCANWYCDLRQAADSRDASQAHDAHAE